MIDTHAHVMFPQFKEDLSDVFARAKATGVTKILNVGCSLEHSRAAVEMLDLNGFVEVASSVTVQSTDHFADSAMFAGVELFATVGLHPYDVADLTDEVLNEFRAAVNENERVVAIGEIGLDYFKSPIEKDIQKAAFRRQLELARELNMPVIIHNREADDDTFEILSEFPDVRAVFHCYGSDVDFARKIWACGYLTSFTGIITFPKSEGLRDVVSEVPLDKFMVETDCPYLAPQSHRGERNEPSFVVEVAEKIAELKGISVEEVARISTENAEKFFGI